MADLNHLFGSCACERNQYEVIIPAQSASLAQVFFDNTALSRTLSPNEAADMMTLMDIELTKNLQVERKPRR